MCVYCAMERKSAVTTHSEKGLQCLLSAFCNACSEFGLPISKKKTQIVSQCAHGVPSIFIDDAELEMVDHFTYLGSVVNSKLSLDQEINIRIGKAATTMNRLTKKSLGEQEAYCQNKSPCLLSLCP